ncbi:MAG: hypothetical protein COV75_07425 [Candidatus Omnitrophica bacterium CG11_big_fil_rev_8_21_14_0_20_63_9]|nr:MAG: hypothetical protein COV75_07425 [Candidatus Omnitrophica bacterium CG11_big_fil_rev_8_21_14_0_20_63_9]
MTNAPDEDFIVYPPKAKTLGWVAVGLALTVMSVLIVMFHDAMRVGTLIVWISGFGALFFGLGTVYMAYRFSVPTPALVVNRQGILDRSSLAGMGMIPWEEIAAVVPYRMNHQDLVGIVPKSLDALHSRVGPLQRMTLRSNQAFGLPPVNIATGLWGVSAEHVVQIIRLKHPAVRIEEHRS